jgi:hypothetical protein
MDKVQKHSSFNVAHVCKVPLWSPRKPVMMFPISWYRKNINTPHPSGMDAHYSQEAGLTVCAALPHHLRSAVI